VMTVPPAQPRSGEEGNQRNLGNQQPTTANIFHVVVTMRGPSGRSNRLDAYKIGQTPAQ
jgi:hypothetical protein